MVTVDCKLQEERLRGLHHTQAVALASVVWSALRTGSNTNTFLSGLQV